MRLVALLVALAAAGCRPGVIATPTPTPAPVATPTPMPATGQQPSTSAPGSISLRIWLPPDIASASIREQDRAWLFSELLAERADVGQEIVLTTSTKALHGTAGLRESILATAPVAPARLPHLALVDAADLPALAAAGLAQPLASTATPALTDELLPLAIEAVTVDGIRYGVPLCADLILMAYEGLQAQAPPTSWSELLSGNEPLLFPAARGTDAADVLLSQYLSEGGGVASLEPVLDTAALARALSAYQVGRAAGALHERSTSTSSFEEAWADYLAGHARLAAVTSLQVLRDGDNASSTVLGALPASGPRSVVLGRVLAWVVLTPEPEAQKAALALAGASLDADVQRLLAASSYHLPVTATALNQATPDLWREQLSGLYARALPLPASVRYAAVESALADAAASVAAGAANPAAAASLAAARIAQFE